MLLKSTLHRHFTFLQQYLCTGSSSSSSSTDSNNSGIEAVQQLLIYICECIVSIYLELLLTNTSITMSLTTISRLSEDLELLTKLFDELRIKVYLSRLSLSGSSRAPHVIESNTTNTNNNTQKTRKQGHLMSFNLKPKFSNKKTLKNPVLEPGKVPKREIKEDENKNTTTTTSTTTTTNNNNINNITIIEEESKIIFKLILQPLTHVILAVQMNNQYLPDFIKSELFHDFGCISINIWQLIMYWRKENKEDIQIAYERLFQEWLPLQQSEEVDIQLDISNYMNKVKAANIVKL